MSNILKLIEKVRLLDPVLAVELETEIKRDNIPSQMSLISDTAYQALLRGWTTYPEHENTPGNAVLLVEELSQRLLQSSAENNRSRSQRIERDYYNSLPHV